MNNNNRFFDGVILGAALGGAAVFLFGTRTGRNLVKILSEQGLEGLTNILEEYDLADIDEEIEENFDGEEPVSKESAEPAQIKEVKETVGVSKEEKKASPKRFFHRIRK